MFGRNFFGGTPWGSARLMPTARLAGAKRPRKPQLGQLGNGCKIPGTELRPVFDMGSGFCSVAWMDTSNAAYPDCVQAPDGYQGVPAQGNWISPQCGGGAPAPGPEPLPPEPEPTPTPEPIPGPTPTPGPIPDGGEGYYTTEPQDCPAGQAWNVPENKCTPGTFSACRNPDGSWRLFDMATGEYYGSAPNAYANGVNYPAGVTASVADANGLYCQEHQSGTPVETPVQTPPVSDISPAPAPAPVIQPVSQVGPGASVPIVPGPFQSAPMPTQVRMAPSAAPQMMPQQQLNPIRPSCQSTPYKSKMFPTTTVETRPDAFTDKEQWNS